MLTLGNLIITRQKNQNMWFNFCGMEQNIFIVFKRMSSVKRGR